MSGTMELTRVAGIASGFPSEIDATVKVRYVAPFLTQMSDREADFLKYIGGVEQFNFNNTKIEWVEDDIWNRRLTHTGLTNSADTSLVVTGQAHRYPVGTILYNRNVNEYTRVTAHADADTLTIGRDIIAGVTEGAWASTDEVIAIGVSMDENDDYVFRPTSIFSLPYNVPQIFQTGVQASFRRMETALHGLKGSDLDKQASDTVAEQFVLMEEALIMGSRFAGTSGVPSMFGGMRFYITSANGAGESDLGGVPLTRKDFEDMLQDRVYAVGRGKVATTVLISIPGKRKVDSFWASAERMGSGMSQTGGVTIDRINSSAIGGTIEFLTHTALAKDELYFCSPKTIQLGHHGALGRPQLRQLPPSTVGPRSQKVFYADVSAIISGVEAEGHIYDFSISE